MKHPSLSRLLAVFWALCLLCLGAAQALEVPTFEAPVNDQARLLPEGVRTKLNGHMQQAQQKYGVRIAALIVPSLEGESMDSLTTKTAAAWGFGKQGEDKGVLLLVALKEGEIRIETGRGVEDKLTEALGARIINEEIRPFIEEGDAARGVTFGLLTLVPAAVIGKFTPSEKALESAARVRAAAASAGQGAMPPASVAKPEAADVASGDAAGDTESSDVGGREVAGVLLLFLSAALGLFVRRHNWGRVCLAALMLGAAGSVFVGHSLGTTQEHMTMAIVGGVLMGVPVFAFVALFSLVIRIAWRRMRRDAAPALAPSEVELQAAVHAVEHAAFSAPAMERTDFSAFGGQKQSTWKKETPEEARARHQAMSGQQQQQSLFKEVFDELFAASKASKEPSWSIIAIASGALLLSWFIYSSGGDQMAYQRAAEREEVTAHLTNVRTSCTGRGDSACTHTPIYTYSFQGETRSYRGRSEDSASEYAKPFFAKTEKRGYYKNSKGEWVLVKNTGFLDRLMVFGGAAALWLLALGALVFELKKLLSKRGQGEALGEAEK